MASSLTIRSLSSQVTFDWQARFPDKSAQWRLAMEVLIGVYSDNLVAEKIYPGMADLAALEKDAAVIVQGWYGHLDQYALECAQKKKDSPVYQFIFDNFRGMFPLFAEALFSGQLSGEVLRELDKNSKKQETGGPATIERSELKSDKGKGKAVAASPDESAEQGVAYRQEKLELLVSLHRFEGCEEFYKFLIMQAEDDSRDRPESGMIQKALGNLIRDVVFCPKMEGIWMIGELIKILFEGDFKTGVLREFEAIMESQVCRNIS